MSPITPLSEQLDRLAEFEPATAPFISLYLNAQPSDRGRDQFSGFLKKELPGRAATYATDSEARASLDRDIQRIDAYLASEVRPSANGIAIFACAGAGDFFEAVQLDAPIEDHALFISDRPQLYPLAQLDSRYPRCAAVVCDTNRARIFVLALAQIEQQREITGTKTRSHDMGGWSQARYQRHIENFHTQHAKEVAETLERIVTDEDVPHVILFGDAVILPMLREQMSPHVLERVIDAANLPTTAPDHEVLKKSLETLERHNEETDKEKVEAMLGAYRAGGLGVAGLKDTKLALEIGQVDELLLSPTLNAEAAETVNELVAKARQTAARVTIIEDAALLESVGGVGALLRYKVPGVQRRKNRQPAETTR
jgi:peptide subunit release factor 1 (eRF1)